MSPDIINACFEFFGAWMICINIHRLWNDKQVRGAHWGPLVFFTSWGIWNLYFYPHLDQWWSFAGGVTLAIVNAIYLAMILYYWDWKKLNTIDGS